MKVIDLSYWYDEGIKAKLEADTKDFVEVLSVELSDGGYEWDSLEAWYSPSKRKFFWLQGSGCSCNSLGEDVNSIADLEVGNREELITALRAKYDNAYGAKAGDLVTDIAKVKAFRAP